MARPERELTSVKSHQDRYLEARRKKGTLTGACKLARVSTNTVYLWRDNNQEGGYTAEEFKHLEKSAIDAYTESLEDEADRRAVAGVLEPVYHKGKKVGSVRKFSDTLLIFRLKALAPEKYRERISAEHSAPGGGPIQVQHAVDLSSLSTDELLMLEKLAGKVTAKPSGPPATE